MEIVAFEVEIGGVNTVINNVAELRQLVKESNKEFQQASIGTKEYEKLARQVGTLKEFVKDVNAEIRKQGREAKIAADAGNDSYRALNAQLVNARAEFKELGREQREGAAGEELLKTISRLDKELKDIDASIGNFQRNVGNYADTLQSTSQRQEKLAAELKKTRELYASLSTELQKTDKVQAAFEKRTKDLTDEIDKLGETTGKTSKDFEQGYVDSLREATKRQEALIQELKETEDLFESLPDDIKKTEKAQEEFAKRTKELTEEIDKLGETTGKTTKDLEGGFVDALSDADGILGEVGRGVQGFDDTLKALTRNPFIGILALLIGALTALVGLFTKTERGADLVAKATGFISGVMSELVGLVDSAVDSLLAFAEDPLEGIQNLGQAIADNLIGRFQAALESGTALGRALGELLSGNFQAAGEAAAEAGDKFLTAFTLRDELLAVAEDVVEIAQEVNKVATAFANLEARRRAVARQNIELQKSIESIRTEEELLRAVEGDNTASFLERTEAIEGAIEATQRRARLEVQVAQNNLSLINEELALRKSNGEDTLALLEQQLGAFTELENAERELTVAVREATTLRNQLRQDELEKNLDILLDGFANQKAINDDIISNERVAFEEREKLSEQTRQLSIETFQEQLRNIQTATGAQINANELLQESDSVRLNELIRGLGLSEILEGRLLEVIRDRRDIIQSEIQQQQELNDERGELAIQAIEAARDLQIAALNETLTVAADIARQQQIIELETAKNIAKEKLAQDNLSAQERAQIELELQETIRGINENANRNLVDDRIADINRVAEEQIKQIFATTELEKIEIEEIQAIRDQAAIDSLAAELGITNLSAQERLAIEAEVNDQRVALNQAANERIRADQQELLDGIASGLDSVGSAIGVIETLNEASTNRRLGQINERYDAELAAAEGNAEEIERITAERDAEIEAIEREAFERQKRLQIAQALVSGAQAIISTLAAVPGPIDILSLGIARTVQLALVAATTAAQIAAISSQTFDRGGYTGPGRGKPDNTGHVPVGVVHANEYVVPPHILRSPKGSALVNRLEDMRIGRRGGVDEYNGQFFAADVLTSPEIMPNLGNERSLSVDARAGFNDGQINRMGDSIGRRTGTYVKEAMVEAAVEIDARRARQKRLDERLGKK